MHEPILHIYQDGDEYFAALPSFVDLQESPVVRLDRASARRIKFILKHVGSETGAALYFDGDERHLANQGVEHWELMLDCDPPDNEIAVPSRGEK